MSEENKKEITQEEAAEEAKKYSSKVTEDDVSDMVSKEPHQSIHFFFEKSV